MMAAEDQSVDEVTRQRQKDCGIMGGYKHPMIKNHGSERCVKCGISAQDWDKMMTDMATQHVWGLIP
jgi:hypothetical protein